MLFSTFYFLLTGPGGGSVGGLLPFRMTDEEVTGLLQSVLQATKASNALPSGSGFEYLSSFPKWVEAADDTTQQIVDLIDALQSHLGGDVSSPLEVADSLLKCRVVMWASLLDY